MTWPAIRRRSLLAGVGGLFATPAVVHAQSQTNGVALVIGNSRYKWEASLPNVRRDAPDVARAFQALGLKTELVQDAGREAMRAAIEKFKDASQGANFAAFYFAGHGATWDKDTYLVPEDADLANPGTVRSLLSVAAVGAAMRSARHRLLVFDNCRNNPADGWRQTAAVSAARANAADLAAALLNEPDTLTLYSTASGRTALDGPPGENSPFAAALLRQLAAPAVDLQKLPNKLRRDLLIATECRQLVWDQNTFARPFALNRAGKPAAGSSGPGRDPSRIVELPNAYAFAQAKGLYLPAGLIAWRPPAGSPHAQKVGSYECTRSVAAAQQASVWSIEPTLILVLAAEGQVAEVVNSARDFRSGTGKYWNSRPAALSADGVMWVTGNMEWTNELKWRDGNSGTLTATPRLQGGPGIRGETKPFKKLDG